MASIDFKIISGDSMGSQLSRNVSAAEETLRHAINIANGPSASDSPAAAVIATQFDAQIGELRQRIQNTDQVIAKYNTADSYLGELRRLTNDMRELPIAASNSATLDDASASAIQDEAHRLAESYNRILETAEYNGAPLFDGGERSVANLTQLPSIDFSSPEAIEASLVELDNAAAAVDSARIDIGSTVKHDLKASKSSLEIELENLSAARSEIGFDLATAMTDFIRAMRRAQIEAAVQAHSGLNQVALYDLLRPPEKM